MRLVCLKGRLLARSAASLHHARKLLAHAELWFHYGRVLNHKRRVYSFLVALRGGANTGANQGARVREVKPSEICVTMIIDHVY